MFRPVCLRRALCLTTLFVLSSAVVASNSASSEPHLGAADCFAAAAVGDADHLPGKVSSGAECAVGLTEASSPGPGRGFIDDVAMGGVFFGSYDTGLQTGNAAIAIESARRFRAERSGNIEAVRYNNRVLTDSTIAQRCAAQGSGSQWCTCRSKGLDSHTCGYSLSNSYSIGNGGHIVIEIREDRDGVPADVALGRTRGVFIPQENAGTYFPTLPLESPVFLESGRLYHLVFRNLARPTRCRLSGVDPDQARGCERNAGAIGLNGVALAHVSDEEHAGLDPYRGTSPANFVRFSTDGNWAQDSNNLSWYEVGYTDGVWTGDSNSAYDAVGAGRQIVEGSSMVRQVFEPTDVDRTVDGLWVNLGHRYQSRPDGSDMSITLRDGSGATLASGRIEASDECLQLTANASSSFDRHCRYWSYADLSTTVALNVGQRYSVEFSAGRSAGYVMSTTFPIDHRGAQSRNHWNDARAERSSNGGKNWSSWPNPYSDRDLALLFTTAGKPRKLP